MVRAMAALIEPDVRQFYGMHDFASLVRTGAPLPVRTVCPTDKGYACAKCGAAVANKYEVRRHPCKWGGLRQTAAYLDVTLEKGRHACGKLCNYMKHTLNILRSDCVVADALLSTPS